MAQTLQALVAPFARLPHARLHLGYLDRGEPGSEEVEAHLQELRRHDAEVNPWNAGQLQVKGWIDGVLVIVTAPACTHAPRFENWDLFRRYTTGIEQTPGTRNSYHGLCPRCGRTLRYSPPVSRATQRAAHEHMQRRMHRSGAYFAGEDGGLGR